MKINKSKMSSLAKKYTSLTDVAAYRFLVDETIN